MTITELEALIQKSMRWELDGNWVADDDGSIVAECDYKQDAELIVALKEAAPDLIAAVRLLREVRDITRHSDYDWDLTTAREVDAVLAKLNGEVK
jgi:hypothetical protein